MTPIANNIGVAGQIGFGVGICPLEYDGMSEMQELAFLDMITTATISIL